MEGRAQYGHDTDDPNKPRTEDVLIFENVDFASMLLPQHIVDGLYSANFRRPSPIQLKAVPLARCGFDLIVQAKSGTGKTLVFAITCLDVVKTELKAVQVLIIAPTREIALQIVDVISVIGSGIKGLQVKAFIGGLDPKKDKKDASSCHVAVVTPGRARQLVREKILSLENLKLLVLDEADKLMETCFSSDINNILKAASGSKQIILASATLCDSVSTFMEKHMNEPMRVTATGVKLLTESENDTPKVLLGVKQFVAEVQAPANIAQQLRQKADKLMEILKGIPFKQCIVFSNYQTRAESICNMLTGGGWPTVSICGKQEQTQRIAAIAAFKEFRCRVLLSTDLTARGLDVHGVSLVVNLDVPYNSATYLHRMGRAGRFGSRGLVITLVASSEELTKFQNILYEIGGATMAVHKLPTDLVTHRLLDPKYDTSSLETIAALPPEDINANTEDDAAETPQRDATENKTTNGAVPKHSSSTSNGIQGLCNALLETYLEPKPALEIRSYEDLDSSRKNWVPEDTKPAILKKDNNLGKYASEIVTDDEPAEFDEKVLKAVLDKNWSDLSSDEASSNVDASSESESSESESTESELSSSSVPVSEVRQSKNPTRKTVTVNLPESDRRSSAAGASSRRKVPCGSSGRCCNHICENAQSSSSDYYQHYDQGDGSGQAYPNWYSQYYSQHQGYSGASSQWYSHWESQLRHIRFYVEYMEYWKNSYMNMYSSSSTNT